MNGSLLQNSLLVSGVTTLLSVGLGFTLALRIATAAAGWRRLLLGATLATLALPPFLVVNTWLDLLGTTGLVRRWVPMDLFSIPGTIGVLTLMLWPIGTLLTLGAWNRIECAQLESDPRLRGTALLRWLLWPAARGALGLAALLIFVLALNQFSIPVVLQVPVFPEELWLALTTRLNEAGAWAAAWPMLLAPALLLFALRRRERDVTWPRETGPQTSHALARQLGGGWLRIATLVAAVVLGAGLILPIGQLLFTARTWAALPGLFKASRDVVVNSLLLAVTAATVCAVLGGLASRWRGGWMAWVWLMFFMPGMLLGRVLIAALGQTVFYGTVGVVLIGFALRYLAVGWQGAVLARGAADPTLVEAGRLEGIRGWALFRHFTWPQVARPLAATWYVIYLLALWDVETLVLIYPPGGETLALRVFNLLHYGHNAQVNAMCVALLALAATPLLLWQAGRAIRSFADLFKGG